ncbi:protein ZINC INDUCED FACILITATOR-LIKE 1-like [Heracleum sosnowskyi]|uniref:Protein ZINC INDUCED FACILITATOR-LIKE 1-like n=1 Tax=Heracleum sosnowskyi TaxID=360622 RepID=A0AAD8ITH9_9APIA|nr:protein ZINC INDUCED FACILITATOR-LIKE 1-like [Heracleum sosnowskyi]
MASEDVKETLLEKQYFEGCPGCKVDKHKVLQRGVPYRELFVIWVVVLATALPISSLFPFLYFMVRDFNIAKEEEDISYYAGYVGSTYMLGRVLTSVFWGWVADRYGRKVVIIFGTFTIVVLNTLFGLSINFWMAIATRFLLGSLNGVLGPIKAYASEVVQDAYQPLALSTVSTAWGTGLIIGPALGGFLAQPADKFPAIFSQESIFGRFPYFLPCLAISLLALVIAIACFWLPETLHNPELHKVPCDDSLEKLECAQGSNETEDTDGKRIKDSTGSLFTNWPLMSSILVYCVFSLHDMAYTEIFSLWAVSPRKLGGLNYSTDGVGEILAISGFGLLVFQLFLFPPLERRFGFLSLARVSGFACIPLLTSYSYIALLSGVTLALLITCASVLKNVLSLCIITGMFILQNRAVDQHQRGAANGLSMTAMSLFKAIGPAGGGAVLSWAQGRQDAPFLPGTQIVFFILNVIEAIGIALLFKPFLVLREP